MLPTTALSFIAAICSLVMTSRLPVVVMKKSATSTTLDDVVEVADFFITTTGNRDVITSEQMAAMKDKAVVGNIGHFDNEIDMAGLATIPRIVRTQIKPQVHEWTFPADADRPEH